jgi:hypothetical protein
VPSSNGDQGGEGRDLRIAASGQLGQGGERRQQEPQQHAQQHLVLVEIFLNFHFLAHFLAFENFRSEEPALTNMDISTGHMVLVSAPKTSIFN